MSESVGLDVGYQGQTTRLHDLKTSHFYAIFLGGDPPPLEYPLVNVYSLLLKMAQSK